MSIQAKRCEANISKIGDLIFRYRYWLGGIIFLISILFEINGSSIGCWNDYVPGGESGRVLLGKSRGIRGDEWLVNASMLFSQHENGFPYFNNMFRAAPTDMFIIYGQPVKDIAILFRPFHWGYLFLSLAKGFSFYWMGKIVALALISFEMGLLLTKSKRSLSFLYMILLCLSPVTQWWFGVNAFPDMLVYGQAAILLIYYYLQTNSCFLRVFFGIAFAICSGAYALVFYPAWQIPFAYVFLVLAIWVVLGQKKLYWKKDIPIICTSLIILVGGLLYVYLKSQNTIQTITNSAYPGKRLETGGGGMNYYFQYLGNLLLGIKETSSYGIVAPEVSVMFDLFPMGQIMAIYFFIKERRKDTLLILLEVVWIFLSIFVVFGLKENIANITLLSNSTAWRAYIAIGYLNILLLIRALTLVNSSASKKYAFLISAFVALILMLFSKKIYNNYISNVEIIVLTIFLFILCYCLLNWSSKKLTKFFLITVTISLIISNGLINPIRTGIYNVSHTPLGRAVGTINKENPGVWVAATGDIVMGNFLGAMGVKAINPTNTYPQLERWHKLDPTKNMELIYNRYAAINVEITELPNTAFTLLSPDAFKLDLSIHDIDALGADYILTNSAMQLVNTEKNVFKQLYIDNNFSIYQVLPK